MSTIIPDRATFEEVGEILTQALLRVPPHELPSAVGWLARLQSMAQLRMMQVGQAETSPSTSREACNYLSVQEVSERFHVKPRWLYRHKKQMPHSQPSQKVLLFPEQSITRWFASRKGT